MIPFIVILPLIASFICCIALRPHGKYPKYIALAASIITLLLALAVLFSPSAEQNINWFTAGPILFTLNTATYTLNKLLLILVALMAPIIVYYSFGIINTNSEQGRYYSLLSLFTAAMLLFSISNGLITLLISWSLLGITSYLMIGFWYKRPNASAAARKAITTMIIGDMAMVGGIAVLWAGYHAFSFTTILAAAPSPLLVPALLLMLVAVFTKSAQFPFTGWLPDAMEGPTPVSAFIHSSTMVKAGVFLVALLLPLFSKAGLGPTIVVVGCITALIGATNALRETHIKRILAYSTLEDIGIMFIALGFLGIPAAMLLFFVQTFYKALLFLSAGSIITANNGEEDITKVYGLKNRKLLLAVAIIAALSLVGVFPLGGFFGKAAVATAASGNLPVYLLLALVELISTVYMARWIYLVSRDPPRALRADMLVSYRILPKSLVVACAAVFVLLIASSLYPFYLTGFMHWTINITVMEAAVTTAMVIVGATIAFLFYFRPKQRPRLFGGRLDFLLNSERAINDLSLSFASAFGSAASAAYSFEVHFNRAVGLLDSAALWLGRKIGLSENGQIGTYLLVAVIGFVIISFLVMVSL
jgi:NADH-quinone oxidoreductase subunit L